MPEQPTVPNVVDCAKCVVFMLVLRHRGVVSFVFIKAVVVIVFLADPSANAT